MCMYWFSNIYAEIPMLSLYCQSLFPDQLSYNNICIYVYVYMKRIYHRRTHTIMYIDMHTE